VRGGFRPGEHGFGQPGLIGLAGEIGSGLGKNPESLWGSGRKPPWVRTGVHNTGTETSEASGNVPGASQDK
jgi:hypothetical protein